MGKRQKTFRGDPVLELFDLSQAVGERQFLKFMVEFRGWLLLILGFQAYLLSPNLRSAKGAFIVAWLISYGLYLVLRELLRYFNESLFNTQWVRVARIQIMILFATTLVYITGGSGSFFWLAYLWPLFASTAYLMKKQTLGILMEILLAYSVVSLIVFLETLDPINPTLFLTSSIMLIAFTLVFLNFVSTARNLTEDINTAVNLDEVLKRILQRAVRSVDASGGSLMLLDQDKKLYSYTWVGQTITKEDKDIQATSFELGEGIAGWVAQTRKPYICYDVTRDDHYARASQASNTGSILAVPILSHESLLGVINVDSPEVGRFTENDAKILENLAIQAATAIERAELLYLLRITAEKALEGTQDLYQSVVDAVHRLTRCPVVMWKVQGRQTAKIVAARGVRPEYVNKPALDLNNSVTGLAIRERRIVPVPNIQSEPLFQHKDDAARESWRSMLVVPLFYKRKRAVGTLSIYSKTQRDEFSDWELDLLKTFASYAGVEISNAEDSATRESLAEIGKSLNTLRPTSSQSLREMIETIAQKALPILEADLIDIYEYDAQRDDFVLPSIMVGERKWPDYRPTRILADDMAYKIVRSGQSVYSGDTQTHDLLGNRLEMGNVQGYRQRFIGREEILSSAAILLKIGGETQGVLFVNYRQKQDFESDVELVKTIETFANYVAIAINNLRQWKAQKNRAEEVALLQELVSSVNRNMSLEEILPVLVDAGIRLTGMSSGVVHVIDSSGKEIIRSHGYPDGFQHPHPRISEHGYTRLIIDTKKQIVVTDTANDQQINPEIVQKGVRAFVGTPIKLPDDRVLGVLYLNNHAKSRNFTDSELSLLQTFADQVAVVIHKAELMENIANKNRALEALNEIGQAVSSKPIDEILDLIYEQSRKIVDLSDALFYIALYDEVLDQVSFALAMEQDSGNLVDEIRWGKRRNGEIAKAWQTRKRIERFGLTEYVIREKQPTLIEEKFEIWAQRELNVETWPVIGRRNRPTLSWLGVPMIVQGKVIGVISIQSLEREQAFNEYHKDLLSTIANQAAVAIENARLLKQEGEQARLQEALKQQDERARLLEDLQNMSIHITAELEEDELLTSIVESVNQVMGASFSTLFTYDFKNDCFLKATRAGAIDMQPSMPSNTGLVANIVQTQRPVFVEDAEIYPDITKTFIESRQIKSFAGIPLLFGERSVGVLLINFFDPHSFSNEERMIIELLARQVAVAIENATLFHQLIQAQNEIAEQERALIMHNVAMDFVHTINNLVGPIVPWVSLIRKRLSLESSKNPKISKYLDKIVRDAELVLEEATKLQIPTTASENIDLEILMGSIVGQVEVMAAPEIDIEFVTESDILPIYANRHLLSNALYSVVHNATKAISGKGKICIEIKRKGTFITLEVSDTGCGIPDEMLESIFEYGMSYWSNQKGSGYGLWRARGIIKSIGGDITVTSKVGTGSTFTIALPISDKLGEWNLDSFGG